MTYAEKLKDPRWQKKRLEIMQRDEWKCCNCNEESKTLNVHHKAYIDGNEPWDYPDYYLMTLCEQCHGIAHFELALESTNRQKELFEYFYIIDPILPRMFFTKIDFYKGDILFTLRNDIPSDGWYFSVLIATLCRIKNFVREEHECHMYLLDGYGRVVNNFNLNDFLIPYSKERTHLIGYETDKEGKT